MKKKLLPRKKKLLHPRKVTKKHLQNPQPKLQRQPMPRVAKRAKVLQRRIVTRMKRIPREDLQGSPKKKFPWMHRLGLSTTAFSSYESLQSLGENTRLVCLMLVIHAEKTHKYN